MNHPAWLDAPVTQGQVVLFLVRFCVARLLLWWVDCMMNVRYIQHFSDWRPGSPSAMPYPHGHFLCAKCPNCGRHGCTSRKRQRCERFGGEPYPACPCCNDATRRKTTEDGTICCLGMEVR